MALQIRHRRAGGAVVLHGIHPVQVRIGGIAHGELTAGVVDVGPVELAILRHFVLLLCGGKVLVDEICIRVHLAHGGVQTLHALHAALVIGVRARVTGIGIRVIVAEALHQVKTEAVDAELLQPEAQHVGPLTLHKGITLVPVVEHAVGMRCGGVEEWVRAGLIHPEPGMLPVALVEHHVENHCDSLLVTEVDELLIVLRRAVSFVRREIEIRVVAPGVVAVELIDRKKLHGVDSESLQIGNLLDGGADRAVAARLSLGAGEVAEKHLVDYQVGLGRSLEVGCRPFVIEHAVAMVGQTGVGWHLVDRILGKSGEDFRGDIFVVLRVEYEPCVWVAYGGAPVHEVIVAELTARHRGGNGGLEEAEGATVDLGVDIPHHVVVGGTVAVPATH